MATEEGVVIKLEGDTTAWIKTNRSASCKSCASSGACGVLGGGNDMEVKAVNSAGAQIGDRVVLRFKTGSLLKVVFLLYILPILCLLLGAVIGQEIALSFDMNVSAASPVSGFLFFFVSVWFARSRGNRLSKKKEYQPEIIRIVKQTQYSAQKK